MHDFMGFDVAVFGFNLKFIDLYQFQIETLELPVLTAFQLIFVSEIVREISVKSNQGRSLSICLIQKKKNG